MTASDNDLLVQMGNNYYNKPTIGLQILRETVIGPELFDMAFKEYANRWKYKHPNPADLFRTLENATAVDLDWFWKGWFFTTDYVDIELAGVKWFQLKTEANTIENKGINVKSGDLSSGGNANSTDFSQGPQEFTMLPTAAGSYGQFLSRLNEEEMTARLEGKNIYELTFKNEGGLVMPIVIEWTFADGTTEMETLSAEVWRLNEAVVRKTFVKEKQVVNITIDPNLKLADVNMENNVFPKVESKSKMDEFKDGKN